MTDAAKLQNEYNKLVEGLQDDTTDVEDNDGFMTAPGKVRPPLNGATNSLSASAAWRPIAWSYPRKH